MSTPPIAQPRLLVVDDDASIREVLRRYFTANGFEVTEAGDAATARAVLQQAAQDLVLLDIGLPGEDGLTLARDLRDQAGCAVIIVSGRGDAVDRVVGLEVGADDYVSKPFDLRELLARARSVLRRVKPPPEAIAPREVWLEFEGLRLHLEGRRLLDATGREIGLTTGEFELLAALVEQPNRVLTRDALMQRIHGRDAGPFDRAIDMQVGRLRQKLEADPAHPRLIRAVRGAGYIFSTTVRRA